MCREAGHMQPLLAEVCGLEDWEAASLRGALLEEKLLRVLTAAVNSWDVPPVPCQGPTGCGQGETSGGAWWAGRAGRPCIIVL